MSNNQGKTEGRTKKIWIISGGAVIVFGLCWLPFIFPAFFTMPGIYYGSLFFVVLLAATAVLLNYAPPPRVIDNVEHRDFRVIQYILRIALASCVGAVLIGILTVVLALLGP